MRWLFCVFFSFVCVRGALDYLFLHIKTMLINMQPCCPFIGWLNCLLNGRFLPFENLFISWSPTWNLWVIWCIFFELLAYRSCRQGLSLASSYYFSFPWIVSLSFVRKVHRSVNLDQAIFHLLQIKGKGYQVSGVDLSRKYQTLFEWTRYHKLYFISERPPSKHVVKPLRNRWKRCVNI